MIIGIAKLRDSRQRLYMMNEKLDKAFHQHQGSDDCTQAVLITSTYICWNNNAMYHAPHNLCLEGELPAKVRDMSDSFANPSIPPENIAAIAVERTLPSPYAKHKPRSPSLTSDWTVQVSTLPKTLFLSWWNASRCLESHPWQPQCFHRI